MEINVRVRMVLTRARTQFVWGTVVEPISSNPPSPLRVPPRQSIVSGLRRGHRSAAHHSSEMQAEHRVGGSTLQERAQSQASAKQITSRLA